MKTGCEGGNCTLTIYFSDDSPRAPPKSKFRRGSLSSSGIFHSWHCELILRVFFRLKLIMFYKCMICPIKYRIEFWSSSFQFLLEMVSCSHLLRIHNSSMHPYEKPIYVALLLKTTNMWDLCLLLINILLTFGVTF